MGLWAFYFLAKLYLYFRGYIPFHALPNAGLLAFIALPQWKPDLLGGPAKTAHLLASVAAGAALLWYDSYFPPLSMVLDFVAKDSTRPSPSYMASFVMGYWNPGEALALGALFAGCWTARSRRWRTAPLVLVLMAVPAIRNQAGILSAP